MIPQSIAAGIRAVRRRPGLIALIYGMNFLLAFILSVPVYFAFQDAVGPTGFGGDLAQGFDVVLWADLLEKAGDVLQAIPFQLLWMVPVYVLWKVALSVGLIHALRGDQIRSFWDGVGRYTGRGFVIALLFLAAFAVVIVGVIVLTTVLNIAWPGEVGAFWVNFVIVPTVFITFIAVLDLMHDYANIALVVEEKTGFAAVMKGIQWPLRYGQASVLYLLWFIPAALLLALPTVLDANMAAASGGAIWMLFLFQQGVLLLRAAVTAGWLGSEVALFESIWLQEAPRIAAAAPVVETQTPMPPPGPAPDGFASA